MDVRWKHPFAALVSGPSGAGKSTFVKKFLQFLEHMSDARFARIVLYYAEWQPAYRELAGKRDVEFRQGAPQSCDFDEAGAEPQLVIIDDLMSEACKSVVNIFTRASHHRNLSVFFLTQNLFHQGQREISLNANYIVVFKNPRDRAQIAHFARQICPENPRYVQEAYMDATSRPHGYLLFDLKQSTPENCRLRANIFPNDQEQPIVYLPIKSLKSGAKSTQVPVVWHP